MDAAGGRRRVAEWHRAADGRLVHFLPDEAHPRDIVAAYRDRLIPGSYLALSHFTADSRPEEMAAAVEVSRRSSERLYPRSREEISTLFTGFETVSHAPTAAGRPEPAR